MWHKLRTGGWTGGAYTSFSRASCCLAGALGSRKPRPFGHLRLDVLRYIWWCRHPTRTRRPCWHGWRRPADAWGPPHGLGRPHPDVCTPFLRAPTRTQGGPLYGVPCTTDAMRPRDSGGQTDTTLIARSWELMARGPSTAAAEAAAAAGATICVFSESHRSPLYPSRAGHANDGARLCVPSSRWNPEMNGGRSREPYHARAIPGIH